MARTARSAFGLPTRPLYHVTDPLARRPLNLGRTPGRGAWCRHAVALLALVYLLCGMAGTARAQGTGTGLRGEYFNNKTLIGTPALTRTDATVNFDWGSGSPDASVQSDNFSALWTGQVEAQYSETYTFFTTSDDGVRLWVNGQPLVDDWNDHAPTEDSGTITLVAGQRYDLRMEYHESGGGAVAKLWWSSPSQSKVAIPQSQLYPQMSPDGSVRGVINREYWNGISGTAVTDLTGNANFPNNPTGVIQLRSFEAPVNIDDNYGARVRAVLYPPQTGSYTFWVASDDASELWLSTNADPANKALVARVTGWTNSEEWTKYAEQQSQAVTLQAGQKYYIEALHKEGGGGDNLAVAWQPPGGTRKVIDGIYLATPEAANNQPPSVSITSPANQATYTTPANITITANASDSDGTVSKVEFFQGGTKLGEATASPYSYTWQNVAAGSYVLTAKATDNYNAVTTSAAVNITVNPQNGAVAGKVTKADGTTPLEGSTVKIFQGATLAGTATANAAGDYSATGLNAGTYSAEASAPGYTTKTQQGVTVTNGATTTVNFSLAQPITYVYDELGRLVGAIDPTGDRVTYSYDAVGNLLSVARGSSSQVSIVEFSPNSGSVGDSVTIYGTGFSQLPAQNSVLFNGAAAVVTYSTPTQIVTSVPAGATTGPISVTTPSGTASSAAPFTIDTSAAPTITGFTPSVGTAGTALTITGTNFETTTTNDRVTLNKSFTLVGSATATTISTSVPSGATSGKISVATPEGSAVSTGDFFVPPSPYTAADVGDTGRVALGGSRTVSLGSAGQIGLTLFDAEQGQRVSLKVNSSTITNTVVKIYNPDGTTSAAASFDTGGGFMDTPALPASGTYMILFDPDSTYTGSLNFTLYNATDFTGTITPGGAPSGVTTNTLGQNARLTFSGTAGQRVSLRISGVTITGGAHNWADVSIKKPDGTTLAAVTVDSGGGFIDTQTLPAAGAYTVLFDPWDTGTGSATLTLYNVPADASATITPGGSPVTLTTTVPGQNGQATFSGTAGERVSLRVSGVSLTNGSHNWVSVTIKKPDGSSLAGDIFTGSDGFIDVQSLPVAGTYTILADPWDTSTGSVTLTLYDVPADASATITPGGSSVTLTTNTPGQNGQATFSGTAGERVSLRVTGVSLSGGFHNWVNVSIKKPDGTTLASSIFDGGGGFIDTQTLPVAGTYTILVDPWDTSAGSVTLTLYDVPADASAAATVGGSAVSVSTAVPGQNALVTFAGTAGQQVTVHLTGNGMGAVNVKVVNPDGTVLTSAYNNAASFDLSQQTLPASGTYTISIDPDGVNTGTVTVGVTNP